MNKFFNKFHFVARWLMIAGVLAGLCFSSGEGIHLLPFPANFIERDRTDNFIEKENFKVYSLSVHNSGAHSGNSGAKVYKNLKFFNCADVSQVVPQAAKLSRKSENRNKVKPTDYQNAGLLAVPSERAPPVV